MATSPDSSGSAATCVAVSARRVSGRSEFFTTTVEIPAAAAAARMIRPSSIHNMDATIASLAAVGAATAIVVVPVLPVLVTATA